MTGGDRPVGQTLKGLPKRFYRQAAAAEHGTGWQIMLDGRPLRTPGSAPLVVPGEALARAIAAEWNAQGERIDPATMPLTRLVNSAIDGVAGREGAVRDDIVAYAASDLLCYRAEGPEGLVAAQRTHWDPTLDWASRALGCRFETAVGIVHRPQPDASLDAVRRRLEGADAIALTALHVITTLTGSALLALAHAAGELSADAVWAAAHVDEDWQISKWGEDAEAMERRGRRRGELDAAVRLLALSAGN